jgi:acetyl esterase
MSGLHPEIRKVLDLFEQALRDAGLSDLHSGGVDSARAFLRALAPPAEAWPPNSQRPSARRAWASGRDPDRVYYPSDSTQLPVLVWFHGGGWVLGDLDSTEFNCRRLANDVGCVVVSVDYRLAPETPFPGAIDDCFAATAWVAEFAGELGIDARRIAVGSDSAGGNLAACVAYRARTSGPPLMFQLLVYPATDAVFDRPSYKQNAKGYLLTRDAIQWFWDCYVPNSADRQPPLAAPLRAADLTGLPPALILTAEFDPLRDEGEAYGAALAAAGVAAETQCYQGMIHDFFNMLTNAIRV